MNKAFKLHLARAGITLEVGPDETALDVLIAHNIDVVSSCAQGVCGTCLTKVIEGTPEHHDMYLTPEEQDANNCFTPCCSRSLSEVLVVDL